MRTRVTAHRERTLELASAFLQDVRHDLEVAATQRCDLPPRIRTMHARAGHATPEYRTLAIPTPPTGGASPVYLSKAIAAYARTKEPCCVVLAFDATTAGANGETRPVLIAEARDRWGTRLFLMQPFQVRGDGIAWGEPAGGGWRDPGEEEMILDAAFVRETGHAEGAEEEMTAPPAPE